MAADPSRRIDLSPERHAQVVGIIRQRLPSARIWVYGSRAKGKARPKSDLDMVVFAGHAKSRRVYDLEEALKRAICRFAWTCSCGIPCRSASASESCPIISFS